MIRLSCSPWSLLQMCTAQRLLFVLCMFPLSNDAKIVWEEYQLVSATDIVVLPKASLWFLRVFTKVDYLPLSLHSQSCKLTKKLRTLHVYHNKESVKYFYVIIVFVIDPWQEHFSSLETLGNTSVTFNARVYSHSPWHYTLPCSTAACVKGNPPQHT